MDTSKYQDNRIHLRNLHGVSSDEIRSVATTHFPLEDPGIEWLDDASADIVYSSRDVGATALEALVHDSEITKEGEDAVARLPALQAGVEEFVIAVFASQMRR
ncbi:hypothetical protein BJX64DRAFT_292541 [Aspergillus heterothallicus]